jgi:hypothetical protein
MAPCVALVRPFLSSVPVLPQAWSYHYSGIARHVAKPATSTLWSFSPNLAFDKSYFRNEHIKILFSAMALWSCPTYWRNFEQGRAEGLGATH